MAMVEDVKEFWNQVNGKKGFEKKFVKPDCIVLDSEYCSMGRMIALKACEKSGYTYYDAGILLDVLREQELKKQDILTYDMVLAETEKNPRELSEDIEFKTISDQYNEAIKLALSKGPCLIHERGIKEMIEAQGYSCMSVFMYATNQESKRERAKISPLYVNLNTAEELDEAIKKEDKKRSMYHNALSNFSWGEKETYDVCLNTEYLGIDESIHIMLSFM